MCKLSKIDKTIKDFFNNNKFLFGDKYNEIEEPYYGETDYWKLDFWYRNGFQSNECSSTSIYLKSEDGCDRVLEFISEFNRKLNSELLLLFNITRAFNTSNFGYIEFGITDVVKTSGIDIEKYIDEEAEYWERQAREFESEDDGPWGGAFKDMFDYYTWKNGSGFCSSF